MTIDPETLMAYADGELDPLTARRVEKAIAADPGSSAADRGAATFALQQFRLNRAEYGIWRRAQAQADADSGEGG